MINHKITEALAAEFIRQAEGHSSFRKDDDNAMYVFWLDDEDYPKHAFMQGTFDLEAAATAVAAAVLLAADDVLAARELERQRGTCENS